LRGVLRAGLGDRNPVSKLSVIPSQVSQLPAESQPDGVPNGIFFMKASTAWIWPP
jgi:hypothetical protein